MNIVSSLQTRRSRPLSYSPDQEHVPGLNRHTEACALRATPAGSHSCSVPPALTLPGGRPSRAGEERVGSTAREEPQGAV